MEKWTIIEEAASHDSKVDPPRVSRPPSFYARTDLFHNLPRDDDEHLLFPSLYYVATVDQSDPRACENYSRRFFLEN